MAERETEHPRWLPTVNRDYDPILKRWNHPPKRWLWWYQAEPKHTRLDTVAGIVGGVTLAAVVWGGAAWFF